MSVSSSSRLLLLSSILKTYTRSRDDVVAYVACNARDALPRSRKLLYMLELTRSFLKNLRKSTSVQSALLSSCHPEHSVSMDNPASRQDCKRVAMEPYLDTCYSHNNSTVMYSLPFNAASGNLIYCQTDTFETSVNANVCTTTMSLGGNHMFDKQRYKTMRKWKRFGKDRPSGNAEDSFILKLLSFNILAQNLLETHSYLYMHHNPTALSWKVRKPLVLQEIFESEANVICLQEMQEDHLPEIVTPLKDRGYEYLYKKRTNEKKDGLLLLYRGDQFILLDHAKVELYQSGVELLNRDNVGIIAKLSLRDSPETQVVVATTHLLYNPRRNDVRLAQIQLLLAEIERIAFVENAKNGSKYLPILLAGDFNLEPFTGVYKFLTEGSFKYHGKGRSLEPSQYRSLSNSLIPPRLCVTDNCQHFNVLTQRLRREGTGRVMLENSEQSLFEETDENVPAPCNVNHTDTGGNTHTEIEIANGHSVKFSSGTLTHPFDMRSVYAHVNVHGEKEATTHQDEWVTVDYIFYSNIHPVERYTLPTVSQCAALPTIPNFVVGSDHLCIGATFQLPRKKFSSL